MDLIPEDAIETMTVYSKELGWIEHIDEEEFDVVVAVLYAGIGYNVFRLGAYCTHLVWFEDRDEAIEWAVDHARKLIAADEFLKQKEGD